MRLFACGVNYKTAPLALRERLAFSETQVPSVLQNLVEQGIVQEATILSTCNRTEMYCHNAETGALIDWLLLRQGVTLEELESHWYFHEGEAAVRHMMRVASGLDSMILGEPQVLGQMKAAYRLAEQAGTIGKYLRQAFSSVFATSKAVRTETAVGKNPVSVAFAAVSLARRIFSDLSKAHLLLVGAGETITLVAQHMRNYGVHHIMVANRRWDHATALATEYQATVFSLEGLAEALPQADIVVTATNSPQALITVPMLEAARQQRKHKPMFLLDLAVPRNIESDAGQLEDIYLYNIDDLQEVVDQGLESRREAAHSAEAMVELRASHFMQCLRVDVAIATIRAYRNKVERLRDEEVVKALNKLQRGDDKEHVVKELARALTNKLMHQPSVVARRAGYEGRTETLNVVREMFGLEDESIVTS